MTSCVSADDLVCFHAGELPEDAAELVEAHLQSCGDCARRERQLTEQFERLERGLRSVAVVDEAGRNDGNPSTRSLDTRTTGQQRPGVVRTVN